MNKFLKIVLILSGLVLLIFGILFAVGFYKPQKTGILIETTPSALVFVNGIQLGETPYEATRSPGEISLKLVPESKDKILAPFETRISLSAGIKTIVKREFAETESLSSGEIVSFEKTGGTDASLAVISNPDSAQVSIDGTARGFAPYKTSSITLAEHQIAVSAPEYITRTMTVNTLSGYKLTAIVKLAPSFQANPSPTPTPAPKIMIEILQTPGGFLRVREKPSTESKELARVNSGDKFDLIEEDAKAGWYKIEFLTGQFGWVSNQYAKEVEETSN